MRAWVWYTLRVLHSNPRSSSFLVSLGGLGPVMLALALALGCGSPSTQESSSGAGDGSGGEVPRDPAGDPDTSTGAASDPSDPSDPSLEVDPQVCVTDADCMVGTPRNCCIGFCPEHQQAWSRAAWAAYQDDCAVEECANPERLACQPELTPNPAPTAVCERERCVLR